MLKNALLYKDEIIHCFLEKQYTNDYFLYQGWDVASAVPNLEPREELYMYAIVDNDDESKLLGYFSYQFEPTTDTMRSFGLISFDKGNPIVGIDVLKRMEELVKAHHRIEWRIISGNPAKRTYDRFCRKHHGFIHQMHDVAKDLNGKFVDCYVYEIIQGKELWIDE